MKKVFILSLLTMSLIGCTNNKFIDEPKDLSPANEIHNSGFEEDQVFESGEVLEGNQGSDYYNY